MNDTTRIEHTEDNLQKVNREEVVAALKHYVRNHLKPGDLDKVPKLKQFI